MKRILFLMCALVVSGNAMAGELVRGATLIEVSSSYAKDDSFAVRTKGGTGPCGKFEETWIVFPGDNMRSFFIALAAINSGNKVRIHSFDSTLCNNAQFISINK